MIDDEIARSDTRVESSEGCFRMKYKIPTSVILGVLLVVATIASGCIGGGTTTTQTTSSPTQTETATGKLTLRWGTSSTASTGYAALALIADVINKNMPELEIVVVPTAGAVASIKAYANGELDGAYVSNPSFKEVYTSSGRFEGFTPKRLPVQTVWTYTTEITIAIHQKDLDKIKCWSDLNGAKIFSGPLGWDVGVVLTTGLEALDISYEHVEIDWSMVADALERGTIAATNWYFNAKYGMPQWAKQAELSAPIAIVNPCPAEIEKLKAAGEETGIYAVLENWVDPKEVFSTDVKVTSGDKITVLAIYYGFHVGTEVPEDVVYKMLKVLEEHAQELAELNPAFKVLAEDFVGFQVQAVNSNKNIPLHPGLAKYLKEKGVWNDEWKVAGQ